MAQKNSDDDYVQIFYGINPKTYEIESVWQTRDGTLSYNTTHHHVLPGRSIKDEIAIAFGLTDLIQFPVNMIENQSAKQQIEELKKKADNMRP